MANPREVLITGVGVISPIGIDTGQFWDSLAEGRSGVGPLEEIVGSGLPCPIGGRVPDFQPKKYGPNKYMIKKEDIGPYLKSPERLFTEMSVKPQIQNGEPTGGYIITGMRSNALLRKVGLRDGDVILRVNGTEPINLVNIISNPTIREIHVEYIRAGRRQTLHFTIQE